MSNSAFITNQPMNENQSDELVCKHCGAPKAAHHFVCTACWRASSPRCLHCGRQRETYHLVCSTCWKLLPQHLRRSFVTLKIRSLSWLKEFAPAQRKEDQQPKGGNE
jgi:predicted amidophosphoribosyltransferase